MLTKPSPTSEFARATPKARRKLAGQVSIHPTRLPTSQVQSRQYRSLGLWDCLPWVRKASRFGGDMRISKSRTWDSKSARYLSAANAASFAIMIALLVVTLSSAQAQTFTVLHTFSGLRDGAYPNQLVRDAEGNLYGSAQHGGSFNYGTVFRLDTTGKLQVLHNFAAVDGLEPVSPLIRDAVGDLYGVTLFGGTPEGGLCSYGCGTLFKVSKSGKGSVLYAFNGKAQAGVPFGNVAQDSLGNFYGAMIDPFQSQSGGVFKVDTNGK